MRILGALLVAAFASVAAPAAAQDPHAPLAARELSQICDADRARLWGVDLCGPLLVVDSATRTAWSNRPDFDGVLHPTGAGFVGTLPTGVPVANTSVDWAGARWIMVVSPLPSDATERRVLVAHEAWHRIQEQLGLSAAASDCAHLETERGRYFMRLELRALAAAMRSRGNPRRSAARDALFLRDARLREFPQGTAQEYALDRNEGLAAYTGVRLGAGEGAEADLFAARTLDSYDRHEALARAYAYASGPAYGLLLDEFDPNWRRNLGGYAPADMLRGLIRPEEFSRPRLAAIAARYGGAAVATEESARAHERVGRDNALRQRFASGPRLVLTARNLQMEFDPNRVTPIQGLGTFYGTLTVRDAWGELRAGEGALISTDFSQIVVSTPNLDGLSGPGWSLSLIAGLEVAPPDMTGVRTLRASAPGYGIITP